MLIKQEVGMVPHSLDLQPLSWNGCSGDCNGHRQSYHIRISLWTKTACTCSLVAPQGMFIAQRIGEHLSLCILPLTHHLCNRRGVFWKQKHPGLQCSESPALLSDSLLSEYKDSVLAAGAEKHNPGRKSVS